MKTRERELATAQLAHYPKSEILSPEQVIEWAHANPGRMQSVLMTIQYKVGVFYRIPTTNGYSYRGFRYGIAGPDYLSF